MIKDKDNFMCDKMHSNICSTNLAGQKNCDCCDCFYDKCNNCSYQNTGMCINCKECELCLHIAASYGYQNTGMCIKCKFQKEEKVVD